MAGPLRFGRPSVRVRGSALPHPREAEPHARMDTDRNLLFAVLALQAGLIDRERFVQACTLWATRKDVPIADLLVEQGWLTPAARSLVEQLLAVKLAQHGDDAARRVSPRPPAPRPAGPWRPSPTPTWNSPSPPCPGRPDRRWRRPIAADGAVLPTANAGRNLLYEEIGRGGMGGVLRGRDPDLGRELAVKVLLRGVPRRPRRGAALRGGGADRRAVAAPRRRAGLRAGPLRRPPAVLHHEARQGPHPGRAAEASGRTPRARPAALPERSSSRCARRWPTPTARA